MCTYEVQIHASSSTSFGNPYPHGGFLKAGHFLAQRGSGTDSKTKISSLVRRANPGRITLYRTDTESPVLPVKRNAPPSSKEIKRTVSFSPPAFQGECGRLFLYIKTLLVLKLDFLHLQEIQFYRSFSAEH